MADIHIRSVPTGKAAPIAERKKFEEQWPGPYVFFDAETMELCKEPEVPVVEDRVVKKERKRDLEKED